MRIVSTYLQGSLRLCCHPAARSPSLRVDQRARASISQRCTIPAWTCRRIGPPPSLLMQRQHHPHLWL